MLLSVASYVVQYDRQRAVVMVSDSDNGDCEQSAAHAADDYDDAAYSAAVSIETARDYEEERTLEQPQHSAVVVGD